ncbi:MAG TPA: glycosyltransferase [Gaiellaceae bacterium]|nr:glycosyltransferase [Gaiellaceae bacterium]
MTNQPLIAIDALALGQRTKGATRVLANLVGCLPAADPSLRYAAIVPAGTEGAARVRERAPQMDVIEVEAGGGLSWELRGVARAAEGADLLFTIRELVPMSGPPTLMHVFEPPSYRLHARDRLDAAEAKRLAKDAVLAIAFRNSVRRAAAVTAGSRSTAAWLLRRTGRTADVVLPGVDPIFFTDHAQPVDEPPYVLHPASGDPRENTELVLRAFATGRPQGLRLVLVGTPASRQDDLRRRAERLGVEVELPGWVTDERLRELYRGARAVVAPSKFESYAGLQVLEGMALGTPAIALDAPGVTEALEGRAILIGREDFNELADALVRIRDDEALRVHLAARGRELAHGLTWERAAAGFAAAFRKVLERGRESR